jgi:hypothetical protein
VEKLSFHARGTEVIADGSDGVARTYLLPAVEFEKPEFRPTLMDEFSVMRTVSDDGRDTRAYTLSPDGKKSAAVIRDMLITFNLGQKDYTLLGDKLDDDHKNTHHLQFSADGETLVHVQNFPEAQTPYSHITIYYQGKMEEHFDLANSIINTAVTSNDRQWLYFSAGPDIFSIHMGHDWEQKKVATVTGMVTALALDPTETGFMFAASSDGKVHDISPTETLSHSAFGDIRSIFTREKDGLNFFALGRETGDVYFSADLKNFKHIGRQPGPAHVFMASDDSVTSLNADGVLRTWSTTPRKTEKEEAPAPTTPFIDRVRELVANVVTQPFTPEAPTPKSEEVYNPNLMGAPMFPDNIRRWRDKGYTLRAFVIGGKTLERFALVDDGKNGFYDISPMEGLAKSSSYAPFMPGTILPTLLAIDREKEIRYFIYANGHVKPINGVLYTQAFPINPLSAAAAKELVFTGYENGEIYLMEANEPRARYAQLDKPVTALFAYDNGKKYNVMAGHADGSVTLFPEKKIPSQRQLAGHRGLPSAQRTLFDRPRKRTPLSDKRRRTRADRHAADRDQNHLRHATRNRLDRRAGRRRIHMGTRRSARRRGSRRQSQLAPQILRR